MGSRWFVFAALGCALATAEADATECRLAGKTPIRCDRSRGTLYRSAETRDFYFEARGTAYDPVSHHSHAEARWGVFLADDNLAPTAHPLLPAAAQYRQDTLPIDVGLDGTYEYCVFAPLPAIRSPEMIPGCLAAAEKLTAVKLKDANLWQHTQPVAKVAGTGKGRARNTTVTAQAAAPAMDAGASCAESAHRAGECLAVNGFVYRGSSDGRLKLRTSTDDQRLFLLSGTAALDGAALPDALSYSLKNAPSQAVIGGSFRVCPFTPMKYTRDQDRRGIPACVSVSNNLHPVSMDRLQLSFD